jgi:hypothetical protein
MTLSACHLLMYVMKRFQRGHALAVDSFDHRQVRLVAVVSPEGSNAIKRRSAPKVSALLKAALQVNESAIRVQLV